VARSGGDPAVHDQRCAGDKTGRVAGEISDGLGDIVGHAGAADRLGRTRHLENHGFGLIDQLGRHFHAGGEDVGIDEAGLDRVHADAELREVCACAFGQMQHSGLGHGIGSGRIARTDCRDAARVDDGGALAVLHVRHRIVDAHGDRAQYQIHGQVPAGGVNLINPSARAACRSIVEQHVDPATGSGSVIHQCLDLRHVAHIARDWHDILTLARYCLSAGQVEIGGENGRAFTGEQQRCRAADARCRTRDYDAFTRESHSLTSPAIFTQLRTGFGPVNGVGVYATASGARKSALAPRPRFHLTSRLTRGA
jgi:hypothetical protein